MTASHTLLRKSITTTSASLRRRRSEAENTCLLVVVTLVCRFTVAHFQSVGTGSSTGYLPHFFCLPVVCTTQSLRGDGQAFWLSDRWRHQGKPVWDIQSSTSRLPGSWIINGSTTFGEVLKNLPIEKRSISVYYFLWKRQKWFAFRRWHLCIYAFICLASGHFINERGTASALIFTIGAIYLYLLCEDMVLTPLGSPDFHLPLRFCDYFRLSFFSEFSPLSNTVSCLAPLVMGVGTICKIDMYQKLETASLGHVVWTMATVGGWQSQGYVPGHDWCLCDTSATMSLLLHCSDFYQGCRGGAVALSLGQRFESPSVLHMCGVCMFSLCHHGVSCMCSGSPLQSWWGLLKLTHPGLFSGFHP